MTPKVLWEMVVSSWHLVEETWQVNLQEKHQYLSKLVYIRKNENKEVEDDIANLYKGGSHVSQLKKDELNILTD